ncbi:TRAP transporter small permease subunit [Pikeienuella piscinae]|uniref:TRAP transporter small permease protein n=1 Tax=Pikeienuella piscinae TaxID=2748098 RepID=A0A7L5BTZ9_9RHOB|nr:TRAP transporter small permease subunit [Pikeienuella piscinae]QIE55660.1 TRAP transporter small permease subunit [Pikeienuella piscinae]
MLRLVRFIDRLSKWVGRLAGWLIAALTLFITAEVFSRYVLLEPHAWATDVQIMLYGSMIMLGGAFTLSQNAHVRADLIYAALRPRAQASIDLSLYLLFFFPGILALVYAGFFFAEQAWIIGERSSIMADGPPLFPFKATIPVAGFLLTLQGLAEVLRCIMCLINGEWPPRAVDVEEVDVDKLRKIVEESK